MVYYGMRKYLKRVIAVSVITFIILLLSAIGALLYEPWGNIVFSITAGEKYRKVGQAIFVNSSSTTLPVYKAENKPFLIVGPCHFNEYGENADFLFVNRTQIIQTATDKGGNMWCRTGDRLHIIDDLSDCEVLRTSYQDVLDNSDSSTRYDQATDSYLYSFTLNANNSPTTLSIPAKFFTPDMLDAPNRTKMP